METGTRKILKFTEDGKPYQVDTGFPGIGAITRALENHPEPRPVKVIADLAGLGYLNNNFGREIADECLLRAIEAFDSTIAGNGAAGSPSGDEFWAVYHPGANLKSAVKNISNFIKKLQSGQPVGGRTFKLNARALISRNQDIFSDGEAYLKMSSGEKVLPGTVRTMTEKTTETFTDLQTTWSVK